MDDSNLEIGIKKLFNLTYLLLTVTVLLSCDQFLDVVPNNTADVEKAFRMRGQAQKFLYTCYSYLPNYGSIGAPHNAGRALIFSNAPPPGFSSSHEFWFNETFPVRSARGIVGGFYVEKGEQKTVKPYFNYWGGGRGATMDLYEAIRKCNVFLKNIHKVTNMAQDEKKKWAAEVKFLKAYYNFYLIRMYGPIILNKDNASISTPKNEIDVPRAPVDSAFNYVKKLLNEVIHTPQLPDRITNRQKNLGRITKSIAYAMKAKVEVFAASPLFDGNKAYKGFENINGDNPFDTQKTPANWDSAASAAKEAIDFAESNNFTLYKYRSSVTNATISDSTKLKMTIRNSFASDENNLNSEVIWPAIAISYRNHSYPPQSYSLIRGMNPKNPTNSQAAGSLAPPLKIAEMFYSNHGVPITQDKGWNYNERFNIEEVGKDERFYLKQGYNTAKLNSHREARYYADLAFDGSIYYGSGIYSGGAEKYHYIQAKSGQINSYGTHQNLYYSATGLWIKKLVNYQTKLNNSGNDATFKYYNWPIIRLADLYLLYAEAKNEAEGPGPLVYEYVNKIRKRAGLPTVQNAWSKWSTNPSQYQSKAGMRKIIHRERLIELAFEGHRFWDLRRWKEAPKKLSRPIRGWSISYSDPKRYYKPKTIFKTTFHLKDYFWPISEHELSANPKLTQNPGW